MWWWLSTLVALGLYAVMRLLNLASPALPPTIFVKSRHSHFVQALLASCPILREPYVPPLLWGKSGHIQTVVYAKIGRMRDPVPSGSRHTKILPDGSTLTFDLYTPTGSQPAQGGYCMMVCPGFGSSSESSYIRALVTCAQDCGYHVAVLNHLGCLFSVRLTTPRIFSYGGWEEFHLMRQEVEALMPHCRLIMVGLSMGANMVLKYLGESRGHQANVCCAFSICQGYNINEAKHLLNQWQNMRRAYLYTMTANQRRLIKHHSEVLFSEDVQRHFGLDLAKVCSATTLEDLDRHFSCKLQGYTDVMDYYDQHSCSNYLSNVDIPLVLLNAEDDPIVPPQLLKHARNYAESHNQAIFVTTKHGGHLGYFERGFVRPHPTSWMDRFVCQVADGIVAYTAQRTVESMSPQHSLPLKSEQLQALVSSKHETETISSQTDLSTGEGTTLRHRSNQSEGKNPTPTNSEDDLIGEEDTRESSRSTSSSVLDERNGLSSLVESETYFIDAAACVSDMSHGKNMVA